MSPVRVAAVIQRYGPGVLGGESLCRAVLRHLGRTLAWDVTVLTTCAREYPSWRNEFPPGEHTEDGIRILRFPVQRERNLQLFRIKNRLIFSPWRMGNRWLGQGGINRLLESLWVNLQGPYCPELIEFIRQQRDNYDVFLFYTYLYYHTVKGLELVQDKAILIPFAHDEPPIYLKIFGDILKKARAYIFLSPEEKKFFERRVGTSGKASRIASMKIPTLGDLQVTGQWISANERAQFRRKYALERPYFLYAGRIEPAKGSSWLFERFLKFMKTTGLEVDLVLIGQAQTKLPASPRIRYLGYLSAREKQCAFMECALFVQPSLYESFSMALLEALGLGRPAIVNAECDVLRGHIERSGAGLAVSTPEEFCTASERILGSDGAQMGSRGPDYVAATCTWKPVERAYTALVSSNGSAPISGDDLRISPLGTEAQAYARSARQLTSNSP